MTVVEPYRVILVVQAAHKDMSVVRDALGALVGDAEARGFVYEWACLTQIASGVLPAVQEVVDGAVTLPPGEDERLAEDDTDQYTDR